MGLKLVFRHVTEDASRRLNKCNGLRLYIGTPFYVVEKMKIKTGGLTPKWAEAALKKLKIPKDKYWLNIEDISEQWKPFMNGVTEYSHLNIERNLHFEC